MITYVAKYILTFEKYVHLQGLKVLKYIEVCSETQTVYNKDFVNTFILLNIYILYSWNGSLLFTEMYYVLGLGSEREMLIFRDSLISLCRGRLVSTATLHLCPTLPAPYDPYHPQFNLGESSPRHWV